MNKDLAFLQGHLSAAKAVVDEAWWVAGSPFDEEIVVLQRSLKALQEKVSKA